MAACKCKYCRSSLTTTTAYMEYVKDKKFYFCNQDHYEEYIKQEEENAVKKAKAEELENKFYNLMCEILSVDKITNTALWKEKKELKAAYSEELIISCLEENKDWITNTVNKLDGNIYGKIRYVSTILKNKLGDYKPKMEIKEAEKPKVRVDESFYDISSSVHNKRRSLADLEDEF